MFWGSLGYLEPHIEKLLPAAYMLSVSKIQASGSQTMSQRLRAPPFPRRASVLCADFLNCPIQDGLAKDCWFGAAYHTMVSWGGIALKSQFQWAT